MKYEKLKSGAVKRTDRRVLGLFIDGTGLDRATRRLHRKVDLSRLVKGVSSGAVPEIARYYTLIPYEDDARQQAFLDAVQRAGLTVVVKRLPPKGISRQVSVDIEMTADIVAFALGHSSFSGINELHSAGSAAFKSTAIRPSIMPRSKQSSNKDEEKPPEDGKNIKRIITIVCPSRELVYPISLANELGVDTATADFGQFSGHDLLKSAAKWIDLSNSETIWRD